jgi:hypothetical protein
MLNEFSFSRILTGLTLVATLAGGVAAEKPRPYRLGAVDLKQRVIWGAEVRLPDGTGLAFGGQDQEADDGRPHTRILVDGEWRRIDDQLRKNNPNQALSERLWLLRGRAKATLALARANYFKGMGVADPKLLAQVEELRRAVAEFHSRSIAGSKGFLASALASLQHPRLVTGPGGLRSLHAAQIQLELAAEALAAEPPPRAIDCGPRGKTEPPASGGNIAYDAKTKLYVLFGGDHLDYLTNDTWVFDPAAKRWLQRNPKGGAPPPRANHRLTARGDGTIRLSGGYSYASNTDYLGGQYVDLEDGEWGYDVVADQWVAQNSNAELFPAHSRTYRGGPFHPEYYFGEERPDPEKFEAWLKALPVNTWTATDPPRRPRLNRDWGVARLDPDRDLMLRWSGGHSAHGGSDVPHFHFSTNRWELPFPVEFPLGQLYANTSYPNGFNFNLRPWVTGHTYQNYAYDRPSRAMVFAGRPNHFYIYDPDLADWTSRGDKPKAMCYNSCFYTLTLTSTPGGVVCWDKAGAVHRYDSGGRAWLPIVTEGAELPGAYVDNSSICYDSKRDHVLIFNTPGYNKPYSGRVWALSLKDGVVTELSPAGMERAAGMATIDKCCYDPVSDLVLFGTYLKDSGDHTPTPAYDPAADRWVTLDLGYEVVESGGRTRRAFPHTRSDALMFDPKRNLIWGVDTTGQVYVLRLKKDDAGVKPL